MASVLTDATTPSTPEWSAEGDTSADPEHPEWTADSTSITLRWVEPDDGGSPITSYEIEVRAVDDSGSNTFEDAGEPKSDNTRISNLPGDRTEYTLTGLKPAQEYFFRIRALNNADRDSRAGEHPDDDNAQTNQIAERSDWSTATFETITTLGTTLGTHAAPASLTVEEDSDNLGNIDLTWPTPAVEGTLVPVTRYEIQFVQRDTSDPNNTDVADDLAALDALADGENILVPTPPTNTEYTHAGLPGLTRYAYRVRAVNSAGPGEWTVVVAGSSVTTAARAPGEIMLDARAVSANEILLEWNKPEDNGSGFMGYAVHRWIPVPTADNMGDWSEAIPVVGVDTTLYSDKGDDNNNGLIDGDEVALTAGTTYYYAVVPTGGTTTPTNTTPNFDGTTVDDAMASAMTTDGAPGAPTLMAEGGEDLGSIKLTITGVSNATSLELQRWENGGWNANITQPAVEDEEYIDSGLTPGVKYYYALRATNALGTGPWSNLVEEEATSGNPDPPVMTATAESNTSIRLTWTVPANNGTTITGYQIQKWVSNAWSSDDDDLPSGEEYTATQAIDNGLNAGATHYYRIRAVPQPIDTDTPTDNTDDEGWSAGEASELVTGEDAPPRSTKGNTQGGVPEAPTFTSNYEPIVSSSSIAITWGAAPTGTSSSAVAGYEVHKWNGSRWLLDGSTTGNVDDALTYTDRELAAGTRHYYIVRAVNEDDAVGKWSRTVSGTTTAPELEAPVLTAAERDTTSIRLTWTIPAANGNVISGYTLQRWNDTTFETIMVPEPQNPDSNIALVLAGDTTLYVDTGLVPGKQYWYQIQATVGDGGDMTNTSPYSAIASATTVAAAPGRPQSFTATADGESAIDLAWEAPASDGGNAIIRYELQRWDTDTPQPQWVNVTVSLLASSTSHEHTGLDADTRYVYRLRAVNRAPTNGGLGSWSTIASATTEAADE